MMALPTLSAGQNEANASFTDTKLSILNPVPPLQQGPQLLHELVRSSGQGVALHHKNHDGIATYTYSQLHDAADRLASRITHLRHTLSTRNNESFVIPVLLEQSPLLYISQLAILKAGAAFCPLNLDAPPERLRFIFGDVAAGIAITSAELADRIPSDVGASLILAELNGDHSNQAVQHRLAASDDLAYVMYTSGSTGTPKGVGLSHSAATQALLAHDRHIPCFKRFLQFAAPTFDVSVFEIFFPLFRGSTLVSVERRELLNDLPAVLRDMDVDACELTPTVAGSLLRSRKNAPGLKLLLTIGEMLNAPVVQEFGGNETKESMLWAMYGPTEATIHCTLQTSFASTSSTGNIGFPLDTVSCFIIEPAASQGASDHFHILPLGEVGELAIGGNQLATSYLNRTEQTAAAFISSPYGRVYRTGDKARLRHDGTLECLGRLSEGQVKLRGQRLELGEVEQAVLRTSGCHSAVAAVIGSILVIFCAMDLGIDSEAVLQSCRAWLPQFMVPGEVVVMDELPRLPSGKVDRKRLRQGYESQRSEPDDAGSKEWPIDDFARRIIQTVSETLGSVISPKTILASAGVDSLKAIQLASLLREDGCDVYATELLRLQTVEDLISTCVLAREHQPETVRLENIHKASLVKVDSLIEQHLSLRGMEGNIETVTYCTPLQVAMLAETMRDGKAYRNEIELESMPGISSDQIGRALQSMVNDTEIFRTVFIASQEGFLSVVLRSPPPGWLTTAHSFDRGIMNGEAEFIYPFHVQIRDSASLASVKILLSFHHAIYDGWSLDTLLSDWSVLLRNKQPAARPQFSEVIKFHQTPEKRCMDDEARAFWAQHLLGWNKTSFPKLAGRPPNSVDILTTSTYIDLAPQNATEIVSRAGCNTQSLFQAALAVAWGGILGCSDVVLGSVTSGRTLPIAGIERIIGPCIASLPLRIDLSQLSTWCDALSNITSTSRAMMQHCTLSLAEIKKVVSMQNDDSLYDVLFVYQESLQSHSKDANLIREIGHLDRLETKLVIEVEPVGDGFKAQATFHSDAISLQMVEHLLQQIKNIVLQSADTLNSPIVGTTLALTGGLSIYNEQPEMLSGALDLATSFEKTVEKTPDAEAICFSQALPLDRETTTCMSYRSLNAKANQVARYLQANDIRPGDVVAIIMEKSPQLYASILGIIKAGCAYLPLLPTTPPARVHVILKQGAVKRCVVDSSSMSEVGQMPDIKYLNVDEISLQEFGDTNLEIPSDSSRLSYVIYTSGTTGEPKGVAVTQRNIVSNIVHLASTYPVDSNGSPRLLQACSQAFDVSVFEIFFTWHTGMCLCAAPNDALFADLEHSIRQLDVTHLSLTPTVASLIEPANVPKVQFLVTAGEPMTRAVLDRWGDLLWQGYGPSETTNICSVKRMQHGENIEHLGWVFPNTFVVVLRPNSFDVMPLGWVGELCFGGDQVAAGYLNMSQLTAERFINTPDFGRIYRSGDLGRMLPDGSLVILGRLDDQIKLRGQRIQASEIDSIITTSGLAVSSVTLLVRRQGSSEQLVTLYVTKEESSKPYTVVEIDGEVTQALLAALRSRVPSYMVPSYLVPVSTIPQTSSGKIDRRALQKLVEELPNSYLQTSASDVLDRGSPEDMSLSERRLVDAIASSMQISAADIGRWTPFPAIGLDSIAAIKVSRDVSAALGQHVAVSAFLRNFSVAQLAKYLQTHVEPDIVLHQTILPESTVCQIRMAMTLQSIEVEDVFPCTPLQEAMLSSGQSSYYNKTLLRLHVTADKMRSFWTDISKRHGILRTCFITTDLKEHPVAQVVLKDWAISWRVMDVNVPSLDGAIQDHLETLPEPLDTHQPPVSLALIRYRESSFLSFICHHSLYDGVAMGNLWREVEALSRGETLQPPVSYLSALQEMMRLPRGTESLWGHQFRSFRPAHMFAPTWNRIDQCTNRLSLDLSLSEIHDRLRGLGISLLSLCQAAWANVLSVAGQVEDVCFGNVISGRAINVEGIDRLVAPCFNTIPLRKKLPAALRSMELMKEFQKLNQDLLPYQFTPLRLIQKLVSSGRGRLFESLLLLQQPLAEMDQSVWTLETDSGDMDLPLVCEVVPCPNLNSVAVSIHHDMSMVTSDVATALGELFCQAVRHMITSPHSEILKRRDVRDDLATNFSGISAQVERPESKVHGGTDTRSWTDVELHIRRALAKLSKTPDSNIRRNTTLYQLGLDSINAVQVASMLRNEGLAVSASDVIECLTPRRISQRISANMAETSRRLEDYNLQVFSNEVVSQVSGLVSNAAEVEAILPCTPLQCAMLSSFMQSHGSNYLNLLTYEIDQNITADRLVGAWKQLVQKQPVLRMGFATIQSRDTSFAMVQYAAVSSLLPNVEYDDGVFLATWKQDVARQILSQPGLPPWRVLIQTEGGQLNMRLLIHHALYDAHSLDRMLEELSDLLSGGCPDRAWNIEPTLSAIMSQAHHQDDEAKTYWTNKAEEAVVNSFPIMTPLREEKREMLVCEETSSIRFSELQRAAVNMNASVQAIVQAAWTRVLAAYIGEESVVFGVNLSGRSLDDTREAAFPCLVTLPVVASNEMSDQDLIKSMTEYNTHIHKHQFTPLSKVQQWLGHAATAVFDTLIVLQRSDQARDKIRPWKLVKDDAVVEYPVSLEIEPLQNDQIRLCITHFSDILPSEQARFVLEQFDAVLKSMSGHPAMDSQEIHRLEPRLTSILAPQTPIMPTPVDYVHQFVESNASSCPDSLALEFVTGFRGRVPINQTWTYAQLNDMGNRVANLLRTLCEPGVIVAIHFDKCPEAYFAILGALKAGCAYVALDPSAPSARKEFIVKDSAAACVLCSDAADLDFDAAVPAVSVHEGVLKDYSTELVNLPDSFNPEMTCYCLYTSGTTGTPKGCEITHANTVHALMAFQKLFEGHWDDKSRWLQFASLHFDVSVLEQYWSWSVGIALVAAPKDLILEDLTGVINKLDITHIDLTPSLARLTHPGDVPSLCRGVFITGGESLKQEILDAWGPKAVIYNFYGPTEATIGVTAYCRVPVNGRPSNIGQQFPNVGTYVFHPGTEVPVLRGAVGELCVSGKLVGKGYLNRPDLTKERFPTLAEFGERVYRTGDLVRVLHDGCFEFLGRADDQVKLRGQRLEIGEINHVIRTEVSMIQDVATIVAKHASSGKDVLVSFVVGRAEEHVGPLQVMNDEEGLGESAKAACRERLPGYMVPTYCVQLPYIPLSANNKAEVKELKALFGRLSTERLKELVASSKTATTTVSRQNDAKLIEVLSEYCRVDMARVSADTSIFELGVDSITALQLSSFLKSRGWPGCTPAVLLRNPVISDLASALAKAAKSKVRSHHVTEARLAIQACDHRYRGLACRELGVRSSDIEYVAPCSPLQQGMVSRAMTEGVGGAYFKMIEMRLGDEVSSPRLKEAWGGLFSSEAILRTCFVNTPSGCIQVSLKGVDLPWEEVMLAEHVEVSSVINTKREEWLGCNRDAITKPLKLLLVRASGSQDAKLCVFIFHGIYDGNSFGLMMERIHALYLQESPTRGPSFLQALIHGPMRRYEGCRSFWEDHLKGWQSPSPLVLSESPSEEPVAVARAIAGEDLEKIRQSQNVTLQAVILAAWTSVLQSSCRAEATSTGVIVSGRSIDLPGVYGTVGPLFNTLPFFTKAIQGQRGASAVQHCHDFNVSTLPFQHVPLSKVQKWCSRGQALFDNLFAFQVESRSSKYDDAPWTVIDQPGMPEYPLAFEATLLRDGRLRLVAVAQGQVGGADELERLLDGFERQVGDMLDDPDGLVCANGEVSVITPERFLAEVPSSDHQNTGNPAFEWTDQATEIRRQIAVAAGVSVEDILPETTALELGLDSIDIIKLSASLRQGGIILSPAKIMRSQTVASMVDVVEEARALDGFTSQESEEMRRLKARLWAHVEETGRDMSTIEAVLPPTALQESMVAGMLQSDFAWYFNHDVLEVTGHVDLDQLRDAWAQVVQQSPVLRTGFVEVGDVDLDMAYCQVVSRVHDLDIEVTKVEDVSQCQRMMEQAKRRAIDGRGGKALLQVQFAATKDKQYVVLSIAHALYDGWSLDLLHQDLRDAYHGVKRSRQGMGPYLSELLLWDSDGARDFWANYLSGARPTLIPKVDSSGTSSRLYREEAISTLAMSDVEGFCKSRSVSLQVLCLASWSLVLAHRICSLDVTSGVILSGRDFDGAEDLLFPTINTVAMRCVIHGSALEYLRYLEGTLAEVREHQRFPLRKAQMAAGRGGQGRGLFNSLFTLQKSAIQDDKSTARPLLKSVDGTSALDYPVCVEAEAVEGRLMWRVACQGEYATREDGVMVLQQLDQMMKLLTRTDSGILSFEEDGGVSIGGLPGVKIENVGGQDTPKTSPQEEDGVWDDASRIIRCVLGKVSNAPVESIDNATSLYHLGLDSISAIKVSALLRQEKGLIVRPMDLLRAESINEMAGYVQPNIEVEKRREEEERLLETWLPQVDVDNFLRQAGIGEHQVDAVLPATAMQVHMVSAWQNAQGAVFFPEFRYRIEGLADVGVVEEAWRAVRGEMPLLRSVFVATGADDTPILQIILKEGNEMQFAKGVTPLVRVCVSSGEQGGSVLLRLKIHHALYDGVSLPAMVQRLRDHLEGGAAVAADKDSGVGAWMRYAIRPTLADARDARRTFWTEYLRGVRQPANLGQTDSMSSKDRVSCFRRSAFGQGPRLQKMASKRGVSVQSLFLAACAHTLYQEQAQQQHQQQYPGELGDEVIFGIYLANRASPHSQDVPDTCPTLCLVPLRVRVVEDAKNSGLDDKGWGIVQMAAAIQRDVRDISADGRAEVGLWEIEAWTGVRVSSFVNFLRLPVVEEEDRVNDGSRSGEDAKDSGRGEVRLVSVPGSGLVLDGDLAETQETLSSPDATNTESLLHESVLLRNNHVRNSYPPTIDIEASIQQNGSLDMGVFGSAQRLQRVHDETSSADEEAERLVDMVVECLGRVDDG